MHTLPRRHSANGLGRGQAVSRTDAAIGRFSRRARASSAPSSSRTSRKPSSLSTRSAPSPRRRAITPTSASVGATARSSCTRTRSRACTKTISSWRPRSMSWREHNGAPLDRDVAGSTRKRKNLLDGPTDAPRAISRAVHGRSSSPAMLISRVDHLTACQPVGGRCAAQSRGNAKL